MGIVSSLLLGLLCRAATKGRGRRRWIWLLCSRGSTLGVRRGGLGWGLLVGDRLIDYVRNEEEEGLG